MSILGFASTTLALISSRRSEKNKSSRCWRQNLMLLLAKQFRKMKKQGIFIENLQMETQTVFYQNGNINIYPCSFEAGQHIVVGGDRASQKGRMVTEDDGTSSFRAYATDSGSRYNTLFRTAHGEVKETREKVIFLLRFPKRMSKELITALHRKECGEQAAYIKTRKTDTQW